MLDSIMIVKPDEIEKKSMEIIASELGDRTWPEDEFLVVKRCIHTAADFDYADNLVFSKEAVQKAKEAIMAGASIVTDTSMAAAGINKKALARWGGSVHCFMQDEDVAEEARAKGVTRASVCMERGAALQGAALRGNALWEDALQGDTIQGNTIQGDRLSRPVIFAVGNAPTALIRLYEMMEEGHVNPALIIGAPVGFVNVVESKELILTTSVPYIVARGRKGGSNIAAAICNAILYQCG